MSKETLGDYEVPSLAIVPTEHQWEKKLKNRITNGAVSPLAQYDRMLTNVKHWHISANQKDILHDEAEMLYNRLKQVKGKPDKKPKAKNSNSGGKIKIRLNIEN